MKALLSVCILIVCAASVADAEQPAAVGAIRPPVIRGVVESAAANDGAATRVTQERPIGLAKRINAAGGPVMTGSGLLAAGRFQIRATVYRTAQSGLASEYGLFVGLREGGEPVSFLVRPDGAVAIQQHRTTGSIVLRSWAPSTALSAEQPDGTAVDTLEVRVHPTRAEFFVNGRQVGEISCAASQLDGTPGIRVGGGGDVMVAAFSLTGDSVVGFPGTAPIRRISQ